MSFSCVEPPQKEPLDIQEIRDYLRISHEDEDVFLLSLIRMARHFIEAYTGRSLLTQKWFLHGVPVGRRSSSMINLVQGKGSRTMPSVDLMRGPVLSVEKVSYLLPSQKKALLLKKADYTLEKREGWARLKLPFFLEESQSEIKVYYWAGYGEEVSKVPPPLRQALLMQVAFLYENRGDLVSSQGFSESLWALLQPYRVRHFTASSYQW